MGHRIEYPCRAMKTSLRILSGFVIGIALASSSTICFYRISLRVSRSSISRFSRSSFNSAIRVSIVTPSYNQGRFLEETLQSVLGQNSASLEYLVIDGGSSDNSREILSSTVNVSLIGAASRTPGSTTRSTRALPFPPAR